MPVKGKDEHERELAAQAAATAPADLSRFELPERIGGADRTAFAKGVTALRAGEFYLAHDLWEEVWHGYRPADRRFLQGLIHIAGGGYHVRCGNGRGASSQLGRAVAKMSPYAPRHWGIDVADLIRRVDRLRAEPVDSPGLAEALARVRAGL